MQNTHKSQPQAKAMSAQGHFGMRFLEGLFILALITFLAYILTS